MDFRPDGEMFVRLEGEIDLKEDGSIWVRREQDGVKLVLMRAVALPGRKLQTYTRQADGSEGRVVTRDARKWAKLKPADLGAKADGLILHPSESLMQVAHAWYLAPTPPSAPSSVPPGGLATVRPTPPSCWATGARSPAG